MSGFPIHHLRDLRALPRGNGALRVREAEPAFLRGPEAVSVVEGREVRVIINADDLGANYEINREVRELLEEGRVTSASILANGPAVEDVLAWVGDFPRVSFGAHLNITQGRPLTKNLGLWPILDERARFNAKIRDVKITETLKEAIFKEWCEQVRWLRERGVKVSHLDFHDDVQEIPQLAGVVKRVREEMGLKRVRMTTNVFAPGEGPGAMMRVVKGVWDFAMRRYWKAVTTGGLCGFMAFQAAARAQKFGRMGHETLELMVHPGQKGFREETRMLRQRWQEWMPVRCRLISFYDLKV